MQINEDLIIEGTNKSLGSLNNQINSIDSEVNTIKSNIPSKIQSGAQYVGATNAGIYDFTITFPKAFSSVPTVICGSGTPSGGFGIPPVSVHRSSITTTQFQCSIKIDYSAEADFRIYWIAVGN